MYSKSRSLKAEQNARVSWQPLYMFMKVEKIYPNIQRLLSNQYFRKYMIVLIIIERPIVSLKLFNMIFDKYAI